MTELSRRTFVKGAGAATGAAIVGGTSASLENGPVQNSDALALTTAAVAIGASAALGWAAREYEIVGSNPPAEGLTASGLQSEVYQTVLTRKSTNASTFIDNENILDGVENNAYIDGKIAAIEKLNAGETQSAVETAATDAVDAYHTTILKNFLKSWNESLSEWQSMLTTLSDHPDIGIDDVLKTYSAESNDGTTNTGDKTGGGSGHAYNDQVITLPDGTDFTLTEINYAAGGSYSKGKGDPVDGRHGSIDSAVDKPPYAFGAVDSDGNKTGYLNIFAWNNLYSQIQTKFGNARDGVLLWVDSIYGQVQSGEIAISDLLTPREQAELKSDDGQFPQAVADLVALNVPVDFERKVQLSFSPSGTNQTFTGVGTLGLTTEQAIKSGTTYDPSNLTGDAYFTYDLSQTEGVWADYQTAVDGGQVTFTTVPTEGAIYSITTAAGETVEAVSGDFSDNGDGTFTADLSGSLETNITEVSEVSFSSQTDETQYDQILLDAPFTVESITNTETGESADSLSFTQSEPQTDSNYVTQEKWNQLEQQNQELIEEYEESQDTSPGGAGAGAGFFENTNRTTLLAVGGAALALVFGLGGTN